jgi:hypothetical protein
MTYDDGRVSGDVQVVINGTFQTGFRSFLTQSGDLWLYDEEIQISADVDADMVTGTGLSVSEVTDEATGAKTYEFTWLGKPRAGAANSGQHCLQ